MNREEAICQELLKKFNWTEDQVKLQRKRRIFAEVSRDEFNDCFSYLVNKLDFKILCALTGLDEGDSLALMYHLAREDGIVLSVKVRLPKDDPSIASVTAIFPAAMIYEKEAMDLLGLKITGVPDGPRYPLPDDWPADQFPLRKDWKPGVAKN